MEGNASVSEDITGCMNSQTKSQTSTSLSMAELRDGPSAFCMTLSQMQNRGWGGAQINLIK